MWCWLFSKLRLIPGNLKTMDIATRNAVKNWIGIVFAIGTGYPSVDELISRWWHSSTSVCMVSRHRRHGGWVVNVSVSGSVGCRFKSQPNCEWFFNHSQFGFITVFDGNRKNTCSVCNCCHAHLWFRTNLCIINVLIIIKIIIIKI